MSDAPQEIFVYGTLRPGCAEWARRGYTADPEPAKAIGTLYDYGPFPYFVAEGDDVITGAVLHLTEDEAYNVWRVEIGAGYEEREIEVTMPSSRPRKVVTYVANARSLERMQAYPVITSGDWVEHDRQRWLAEVAELGPVN